MYESMFDHMLTFASELTGIFEDSLLEERDKRRANPARPSLTEQNQSAHDRTVSNRSFSVGKANEHTPSL